MKIVILDGHALNPGDLSWEPLNQFGSVTKYERTPAELTAQRIGDAEIVFLNKVSITREILEQCKNLKYIGILATGYNVVDIKAAREFGVTVTNIPAYSTMAVAQHTFSLLFALTNFVAEHNSSVLNRGWMNCPDFCYWNHPLTEIAGKTFGIVGFGSIGQRVAKIASAFGLKVLVYTRTASKVDDYNKSVPQEFQVKNVSLDDLLGSSDIVSLHCPLTSENKEMINSDSIQKMKDGAILLNTGRGPLICEKAVRQALDCGKLGGFAADVLTSEPMADDNPLFDAPNCVITPHIAWAAKETRVRLFDIALENIRAFLKGEPINVVN